MTVAQLIAKLEEMPQDAQVCAEIINGYVGYVEVRSTAASAECEIFETVENEVCLQFVEG